MKNKVKKEKAPNNIFISGLKTSEIDEDEAVSDPTTVELVELVFEEFA